MIPLTVLHFFMKLYTPIKYRQEKWKQWMYSWIPTYIIQVMYIPEQSMDMKEIYSCIDQTSWSKQSNREFKKGFYVFNYWNVETYAMERLVLHSNHIQKALSIESIDVLWMFDEAALIAVLTDYVKKNHIDIIDLFLNKQTIYKKVLPYKQCLGLSNNLTPRILYLIYQCEINSPIDEKHEDFHVTYFTSDLEECIRKDDEFLIGTQ